MAASSDRKDDLPAAAAKERKDNAERLPPIPRPLLMVRGAISVKYTDGTVTYEKDNKEAKAKIKDCHVVKPFETALLQQVCGSLFAASDKAMVKEKTHIDDACVFMCYDDYPIAMVMDGAMGCNPEHIKQMCHDPVTMSLVGKLKHDVTQSVGQSIKKNPDAKETPPELTEILKSHFKKFREALSMHFINTYRDSAGTFALAIPILIEGRRIVFTAGIGNDWIAKKSKEGSVTVLKRPQRFRAEQYVSHELINPTLVDDSYTARVDREKIFFPDKFGGKTGDAVLYELITPSLHTFQEGDTLILTTDCVSGLLKNYNDGRSIIEREKDYEKTDPTLKNSLKELWDKYPERKMESIFAAENFFSEVEKLKQETLSMYAILKEYKLFGKQGEYTLGDDWAAGVMTLVNNPSEYRKSYWQMVATLDMLVRIVGDDEFLKSQINLSQPKPTIVRLQCLKEELSTKKSSDFNGVSEAISTYVLSNEEIPLLKVVYNLKEMDPALWYQNRDFQTLCTEWLRWDEKNQIKDKNKKEVVDALVTIINDDAYWKPRNKSMFDLFTGGGPAPEILSIRNAIKGAESKGNPITAEVMQDIFKGIKATSKDSMIQNILMLGKKPPEEWYKTRSFIEVFDNYTYNAWREQNQQPKLNTPGFSTAPFVIDLTKETPQENLANKMQPRAS